MTRNLLACTLLCIAADAVIVAAYSKLPFPWRPALIGCTVAIVISVAAAIGRSERA